MSSEMKKAVFWLLFVAVFILFAIIGSSESEPYRQPNGRWSDDPTILQEQLEQESAKRHAEWKSDCRTGRGSNPECP